MPIIGKIITPDIIIYSDKWKFFSSLAASSFYTHYTVCYKHRFVDPQTRVQALNAEPYNNKIKLEIKK